MIPLTSYIPEITEAKNRTKYFSITEHTDRNILICRCKKRGNLQVFSDYPKNVTVATSML